MTQEYVRESGLGNITGKMSESNMSKLLRKSILDSVRKSKEEMEAMKSTYKT
tara:strand:+ start:598 stop:753 length:156 start_codon:yes stop_codon:yes gene_type:complete